MTAPIDNERANATSRGVETAEALAKQAADVVGRLKVGGWESAQALALISIANSLSVIARSSTTAL